MWLVLKLSRRQGLYIPSPVTPQLQACTLVLCHLPYFRHTRLTHCGYSTCWHGFTSLCRVFQHWNHHLKIKRLCIKMQISSFSSKTQGRGNTEPTFQPGNNKLEPGLLPVYTEPLHKLEKVSHWADGGCWAHSLVRREQAGFHSLTIVACTLVHSCTWQSWPSSSSSRCRTSSLVDTILNIPLILPSSEAQCQLNNWKSMDFQNSVPSPLHSFLLSPGPYSFLHLQPSL